MSEAEQNALITQFAGVTGVDTDRARFYLESAAWNLDLAMGSFYDQSDEPDETPGGAASGASVRETPPQPQPTKQASSSSRIATISNLSKDESGSDSDSDREAYYAGGSERGGGQQILDPKKRKKKDAGKMVEEMFKSAKEHGAEEVGGGSEAPARRPPNTYHGTGYRLGDTEAPSISVPGFSAPTQPKQVDKVLKLWKEGFSVDDGPLRSYNDQVNKEFLDTIKQGEVPRELIREAKGGEVNLNMEDHRTEEYVKPKVKTQAFSGGGNRLGSPSATVTASPPAAQAAPVGQSQASTGASVPAPPINESEPTTNIQIRFSDGSRLVAKFNHTHTVGDVRSHVNLSRPHLAVANYVLMTTFPNKELTDDSQTLKEAGLLNAVLVQRNK